MLPAVRRIEGNLILGAAPQDHLCRFCQPSYSIRRGRYWIASAMCAGWMRSLPARSAIVRASLSTR